MNKVSLTLLASGCILALQTQCGQEEIKQEGEKVSYSKHALKIFRETGKARGANLQGAPLAPIITQLMATFSLGHSASKLSSKLKVYRIDLREAALQWADLSGCDLTGATIDDSVCDAKTDFRGSIFAKGNVKVFKKGSAKTDLSRSLLQGARMVPSQVVDCLGCPDPDCSQDCPHHETKPITLAMQTKMSEYGIKPAHMGK